MGFIRVIYKGKSIDVQSDKAILDHSASSNPILSPSLSVGGGLRRWKRFLRSGGCLKSPNYPVDDTRKDNTVDSDADVCNSKVVSSCSKRHLGDVFSVDLSGMAVKQHRRES